MAMLVLLIVHICKKLLQKPRSAIQRLLPPSRAHSYICRPANAICQRAIPRSTEARLEKAPYSKCSRLHQDCNLEFVNEFWYKTSTLYNTTDFQDRDWLEDMEDRNGRNSFFHSAGNCSSLGFYCYWWSRWSYLVNHKHGIWMKIFRTTGALSDFAATRITQTWTISWQWGLDT